MSLFVEVNCDVCVGAGHCELAAPEVFKVDDDTATVVLLDPRPGDGTRDGVLEADDLCPSGAIRVTDS